MNDERTPRYASDLHNAPSAAESVNGLPDGPAKRPKAGRTKRGWARFVLGMAVIGAAFGAVIVMALRFVDGPVQGKVKSASLEAERARVALRPDSLNTFSGRYIMFQYPRRFDAVGQAPGIAGALEVLTVSSNTDHRTSVAVNVRRLPATGLLHDDPSYRFREMSSEQYRLIRETAAGEPVVVMSKIDRQEQTLFWAHNGLELTIAVTSTNPDDDVAALLKEIQSTVGWVQ